MKIKEIIPLLLIVSFLVSMLASCGGNRGKEKAPTVQTVQVLSLKMSSKELSELSQTFFSIDHRKGIIFNAIPLPYLSHFKKVKLVVNTLSTNEVKVFVDGQERKQEADSVNLEGWEKDVRIEIQNKEKSMNKSYKLVIKRYQFDPLLFSWKNLGKELLPESSGVENRSLAESGDDLFLAYHYSDKTSIYKAHKQAPTAWTLWGSSPIKTKRCFALNADKILLVGVDNKLFLYDAKVAQTKPLSLSFGQGVKIEQAMGVFLLPGTSQAMLCLVVEKSGTHKFANAIIELSGGTIVSQKVGYDMHSRFPYKIFDSKVIVEANYPKLIAIGGRTELNNSGLSVSLWSTTTGMDWLTAKGSQQSAFIPHTDFAPTLVYEKVLKRYYLYIPVPQEGYHVYYSDNGTDWKEGDRKIMLHLEGEEIGGVKDMLGYALNEHSVVLLGGKDAAGNWLRSVWMGKPKIYEEN